MINKCDFKSLLKNAFGDAFEMTVKVSRISAENPYESIEIERHDLWKFSSICNGHEIVTTVKVNDEAVDHVFTTIEIPDVSIGFGFCSSDGYSNVYRFTLNDYLKTAMAKYAIDKKVVNIIKTICEAYTKSSHKISELQG